MPSADVSVENLSQMKLLETSSAHRIFPLCPLCPTRQFPGILDKVERQSGAIAEIRFMQNNYMISVSNPPDLTASEAEGNTCASVPIGCGSFALASIPLRA